MRTTVTVRDDIMHALMELTDAETRTDAVNRAIADWVRRKRTEKLRSLRGKLAFDGDWKALREAEIAEAERPDA